MKSKVEMAESKLDSSNSNTFPFTEKVCSPLPEDDDDEDIGMMSKQHKITVIERKTRFVIDDRSQSDT